MEALRVLSPTAILGYGFSYGVFHEGMEQHPHAIAVDAGSTDPGPYYLGAGYSLRTECRQKGFADHDIRRLSKASRSLLVQPAVAREPHLEWTLKIIREIAEENGFTFKMATVHAEIPKDIVLERMRRGKVAPLSLAGTDRKGIGTYRPCRGQMGVEPFIKALETGAQVIVAGGHTTRPCLPHCLFRKAMTRRLPFTWAKSGVRLHCRRSGKRERLYHRVYSRRRIHREPLNPGRNVRRYPCCTHAYEKTNPYLLQGPEER